MSKAQNAVTMDEAKAALASVKASTQNFLPVGMYPIDGRWIVLSEVMHYLTPTNSFHFVRHNDDVIVVPGCVN